LATSAVAVPIVSWNARAQSFPTRPITLVVGYPAGGPTDALGRVLAEQMRGTLGARLRPLPSVWRSSVASVPER